MRDRRRTRGRTTNEILNEGLIFAALTSEDPTLTARYSVGSPTVTYTRASEATYTDIDGNLQISAAGTPRLDYDSSGNFLGYLAEPTITNKCTNYNANPDAGLTNLTKAGDAAATMTRVDGSTELAAAGLSNVCTDGNVIELDNTSGVAVAQVIVGGTTANTNAHTIYAWCLKVSGAGQADIRTQNGAGVQAFTNTVFERVISKGLTPTLAGDQFALQCAAGVKAWFILNQLEELEAPSSVVVTEGSAQARAADALTWVLASNFSDTEGTLLVDFTPGFAIGDQSTSQRQGIASLNGTQPDILYQQKSPTSEYRIVTTNTNRFPISILSPAPASGDIIGLAVRWSTSANQFEVGAFHNATWTWAGNNIYGGVKYPTGTNIEIPGADLNLPMWVKELRIYNEDKGEAWVERHF